MRRSRSSRLPYSGGGLHVVETEAAGVAAAIRSFKGVGADAIDRLKRAFEIKSFARNLPDRVQLTSPPLQGERSD